MASSCSFLNTHSPFAMGNMHAYLVGGGARAEDKPRWEVTTGYRGRRRRRQHTGQEEEEGSIIGMRRLRRHRTCSVIQRADLRGAGLSWLFSRPTARATTLPSA